MKFLSFGKRKPARPAVPSATAIEPFAGVAGCVLLADGGGAYTVEQKLGAGGFADVYRVRDARGRLFALKLLRMWTVNPAERGEILHRFDREFTCSRINSRYLVRSFDKGTHLGNPFFVMEYCPGGSLGDLIGNAWDETLFRKIGIRILKGLRDLHHEGVIHRDLKPINVLFDAGGEALLTDFGISGYLKSRLTVRDWLGHVKKMYGTVVYMPPEQLDAREAFFALGPLTDIFAFGVTMHELLTGGELPFGPYREEEEEAYLQRVRSGHWTVFDGHRGYFPEPWPAIIEGCLQPDCARRFQQAEDILALLDVTERTGEPNIAPGYAKGSQVLRVMQGDQHRKTYDLTELLHRKQAYTLSVGRHSASERAVNDIEITEEISCYISRFHATLEFDVDAAQWYIRDGQWCTKDDRTDWFPSTNGVLVNARRVDAEGWPIGPGDIITLGDTTLRFELG